MLRRSPLRRVRPSWARSTALRLTAVPTRRLCSSASNAGTPAGDDHVDKEGAGRDLAKLAKMARVLREVIESSARKGDLAPRDLINTEQDVVRAFDLINTALDKVGRPCTAEELADRIDKNIIAMPVEALGYKELMQANLLRDTIESTLVFIQVNPPADAMLDTAGKLFCRLDRKAQRQAKLAGESRGDLQSATEKVEEEPGVLKELRPVTEVELARRKAHMENQASMDTVLRGFETVLLEVGRVQKVVKGGTTMSMRALVVIGDRNGTAGFGEGKSDTPQHAVERACRDAKRNLLNIDLHQGRTIFHRAKGAYVKSRVTLWPAPRGTGISANNNFLATLQLFGLKDIGAKLHGPRSLSNAVKALFNALSQVQSPQQIAVSRGLQEIVRPRLIELAPGVRRRKLKNV